MSPSNRCASIVRFSRVLRRALPAVTLVAAVPRPERARAAADDAGAATEITGPTLGLSTLVLTSYTSNLFHEQRRRQSDFTSKGGPGERFAGMSGPADFLTELGIKGSSAWPRDTNRKVVLSAEARYFLHLRNAVANYARLEIGARYDLTRRNTITLQVTGTPKRFRKNYAARLFAGNRVYEPAWYRELDLAAGHRRKWSKRWKTEAQYVPEIRRYLAPFKNRSYHRHELGLHVRRDVGDYLEASVGARGALTWTPSDLELGVPVERSHRELAAVAAIGLALPARVAAELEGEYRVRRYTATVVANDSYFGRTDHRTVVTVGVKRRLGDSFVVLVEASFTQNETNRRDHPNVDPGELGYDEAVAAVGVKGTF